MCHFSCAKARILLQTDQDIKHNWTHAVRWLRDQFEVKEILFLIKIFYYVSI